MSLTRKIGAYLCTAAMVFSLNVKSDALVKEILQVPGIMVEFVMGGILSCTGKSKTEKIFGLIFLFDFAQRTYHLVFGDSNSKAEKTDNKEASKKNEKKGLNA